MPVRDLDRRTFVATTGTVLATLLAGCSGGGGSSGGSDGGSGGSGSTSGGSDGGSKHLAEEPNYDGWFENVDNYDGTHDLTGKDSVSVTVGAGDGLKFAPPAIAVSVGTTVTWKWSGQGGQHNVVAKGGAFESKLASEKGHTFTHTFEKKGVYKYKCNPHASIGMKGAVVVK
ncbi:MAG: halocyanin domain-containing protein [Halopenitus sp.]